MSSESPIGGPGVSVNKAKRKAIADSRSLGVTVPENATLSKTREFNGVQYVNGGNGDKGATGIKVLRASPSLQFLGNGEVRERSKSNSPTRWRKKKGLAGLGEPLSHPRRSARISERFSQVGTSSMH